MSDTAKSDVRPWLPAAGLALALLITSAAGLSIYKDRQREFAEGERELNNLSLAIAEQTDRAFQAVELVQTSLLDRFEAEGVRDRNDFERAAAAPELYPVLKDKISALPQVDAVTVINADGKLINFSRYWPIPDVNVSDRDYFKALSTQPGLSSYVSAPLPNRGSGTWTVYVARKVRGQAGEFLGLVLGALKLEHFEEFYAKMALGPGSAISLLRQDGAVLARYPHLEASIGRSILAASPASRKAVRSDAVAVRQVSSLDGRDRLVSTRALSRYPLILLVGEETDSILTDWRDATVRVVLGTILVDLLIATAVLLGLRQIKGQREAAASAHQAARHDVLTGLPNRLLLRETLAARLSQPDHFALLCVDLDQFKAVNDGFGHPAGDELLRQAAGRLQGCARGTDLVARTGGDEFTLVHALDEGGDEGLALAECLLRSLAEPFWLDGSKAQIGASIGVAIRPHDGVEADELLRNADLALYRAKADGRGQYRRFEPVMAARLRSRRALERDLRRALERDELLLDFQPIVSLETSRIVGCEALLRWYNPERGLVSPCEFIPIAEATGLIVPIGKWVIERACIEAANWPSNLTVSVNLSPCQLSSGRLVDTVAAALARSGLDPSRLELEITETALLQEEDPVLGALHKIRALGVHIALDDFGIGYSSLSHVTSFPFDRIKIDRSFVQKMSGSESSRSVVCTILHLAKRLGVRTTGEGVETPEHLEALREQGCTEGQGFYFGKPQSAAQFRQLVAPALKLVEAA